MWSVISPQRHSILPAGGGGFGSQNAGVAADEAGAGLGVSMGVVLGSFAAPLVAVAVLDSRFFASRRGHKSAGNAGCHQNSGCTESVQRLDHVAPIA